MKHVEYAHKAKDKRNVEDVQHDIILPATRRATTAIYVQAKQHTKKKQTEKTNKAKSHGNQSRNNKNKNKQLTSTKGRCRRR